MANIRQIAKMAGVSTTTVSRVLNNHPYVSEEKREAVWKAVEDNNYRANINAIHLSRGKTFLIGIVLPYTNHPYFGQLMEGISNKAIENNYNLVLFQTNYELDKEIEALNMLRLKQIDGLIICSRTCSWDTIEEYSRFGRIALFEDVENEIVSSTFVDHYKTFTLAFDYLHKHGHRKIGYCVGRRVGTNSEQREAAYRDFLAKIHIPYTDEYIFDNCLYFEDGEHVMNRMQKMSDPPSALLVTSDQVTAGIMMYCDKENISVPGEIALIGFDNQPIAKIMGITTIEVNHVEAGNKLFKQAVSEQTVSNQELRTRLIERNTV